jgi:hypothetical protein
MYVRFASNVTTVGNKVIDVTYVNTVLQLYTGKVARINIIFDITNSTTIIEFNTTTALVEQCNLVIVGNETVDATESTGYLNL